jgi:hypothetical protein
LVNPENVDEWVAGTDFSVQMPDSLLDVDLELFNLQFPVDVELFKSQVMEMQTRIEENPQWADEDYPLMDLWDPEESILQYSENSSLVDSESQIGLKLNPSSEEDTKICYGMV